LGIDFHTRNIKAGLFHQKQNIKQVLVLQSIIP
jgi:hypothetical protein